MRQVANANSGNPNNAPDQLRSRLNQAGVKTHAKDTYIELVRKAKIAGVFEEIPTTTTTTTLTGAIGAIGATGAKGSDGVGVPAGGSTNQVLAKINAQDYNTQWVNQQGGSGGSGTVTSIGLSSTDGSITLTGTNPVTLSGTIDLSLSTTPMVSFILAGDTGTNQTIADGNTAKVEGGTGINTVGTAGDKVVINCDLEGTELKSTGEVGGSKFLREDGDGTCSWQTVSGGTSYTDAMAISAVEGEATLDLAGDVTMDTGKSIVIDETATGSITAPATAKIKLQASVSGANEPLLHIGSNTGYVKIGSQNASFAHVLTDKSYFYFNKPIQFDGGDGVYAYNGDFWVKTDDATTGQPERITIKGAQDATAIGIANTNPQTELDVTGTIRQSATTSAVVHADANGDLGALTIGTGLSLAGSTLSATGGGGGGTDIRQLFKHDQNPTTHHFSPFRLLQTGDTIELGVSSGATINENVDVFTCEHTQTGSGQIFEISHVGTVAENCGREFIFNGQIGEDDRRGNLIGGTDSVVYYFDNTNNFVIPHIFVSNMAWLESGSGGLGPMPVEFNGVMILSSNDYTAMSNKVRFIDAGEHSAVIEDIDPNNPVTCRVFLVIDTDLTWDRGMPVGNNSRIIKYP